MDNNELENQNEKTEVNEEVINTNEENVSDKIENITNSNKSNTSGGTIKISLKTLIVIMTGIIIGGLLASIVYFQICDNRCEKCEIRQNGRNNDFRVINEYGNEVFDFENAVNLIDYKPIIYIYPEQETNVHIKLGKPENLTCTYPKYEDGWEVTASPNGDLVDITTGRKLYALYWEGQNTKIYNYDELSSDEGKDLEGFVVKGENTAEFLEEKLEILGLNEREAEEFIVYWLPQMENNKYNYIRFETKEEIEEEMPLDVEPKPETVIRILMDWKALDKEIEVKEQKLEKAERKGYTVVEWGGSILDDNIAK